MIPVIELETQQEDAKKLTCCCTKILNKPLCVSFVSLLSYKPADGYILASSLTGWQRHCTKRFQMCFQHRGTRGALPTGSQFTQQVCKRETKGGSLAEATSLELCEIWRTDPEACSFHCSFHWMFTSYSPTPHHTSMWIQM